MLKKILVVATLCLMLFSVLSCNANLGGGNNTTNSQAGVETSSSIESTGSIGTGDSSQDKPNEDGAVHTVAFVTNCDQELPSVKVQNCAKISAPDTIYKPGYVFDGWYYGDEKWSFIGYVVTEDIVLEAKWIANENTLYFDGNGCDNGSTESMIIKSGESATLTKNGFSRPGYTFMGWSHALDGTVEFLDGAEYTMGTNSSYTLYAVWRVNENTLVFNGNGSTSGEMNNVTVYTGGKINLPLNEFERTKSTFVGWSTTPNGQVE